VSVRTSVVFLVGLPASAADAGAGPGGAREGVWAEPRGNLGAAWNECRAVFPYEPKARGGGWSGVWLAGLPVGVLFLVGMAGGVTVGTRVRAVARWAGVASFLLASCGTAYPGWGLTAGRSIR
jgi:hypothetical protein